LATAGRLLAGKSAGSVFANSKILQNPIVGLMLGILVTVLMQSSSTTTSIIVGLVAAKIIKVEYAIPMIMGANIGTSVTNTIVSITQIGNREEFRRAFAGAVIHDFFNWLTVSILFILEVTTGYLFKLSEAIVTSLPLSKQEKPPELLKALTKPFTSLIIQIDKKVLKGWSLNDKKYTNYTTLLKEKCTRSEIYLEASPQSPDLLLNATKEVKFSCGFLFANTGLLDSVLGLILLLVSISTLTLCLIFLVKTLNSLMRERLATLVTKTINSDIPYVPWLTGYVVMMIGAVITFLVQSSSVFTATITPLVGTGLITLERAYAMTLGANIGTTTTGLLAALTADADRLQETLQIALCHLFFNISGILMFYPIPIMRLPIPLAKMMGNTVAKHRWFSMVYLFVVFFVIPLYVFGLSLAGEVAVYAGVIPLVILFAIGMFQ
jgi:sodium-dependent phosphate cotransporter